MKKYLVMFLAAVMLLSLAACGRQDNTSPTGQADPNANTQAAVDPEGTAPEFDMQTSEEKHIVNIGEVDKSLFQLPVMVTSFGQSTDASTIDQALTRSNVDHTYKPQANAEDMTGFKTVFIAVGASTKGMGAAGIKEETEVARAEAIMAKLKETGATVVCAHIGGGTRRGVLSDKLTDMVLPQCKYILLKEDANFDYKFTKYAEENKLPITLIYANKDTVQVMTDLFGK